MSEFDVFKPHPQNWIQWVLPVPPDARYLFDLPGTRHDLSAPPVRASVLRERKGRKLRAVDMPCIGAPALPVTRRALAVLAPVVGNDAEILPLACDTELWLINPVHVSDALDETKSDVARDRGGRIIAVINPVFHPEMVRDHSLFLTRQNRELYVTGRFVQAVEDAALTGWTFTRVWEAPS